MRKWQNYTFLHSLRSSPSSLVSRFKAFQGWALPLLSSKVQSRVLSVVGCGGPAAANLWHPCTARNTSEVALPSHQRGSLRDTPKFGNVYGTRSLPQRRHQAQHTLMLAHGDVDKGCASALCGSSTHKFTGARAEETHRLPAASKVVRDGDT